MTVKEATEFLRRNKDILKMSQIAKELGVAHTILSQIINDKPDSGGYSVRLPVRATTRLEKLIRERFNVLDK